MLRGRVAGVDQQEDHRQRGAIRDVAADELLPLLALRLRRLGVAVPGEVDQVEAPSPVAVGVDEVEVERGRLARLLAGLGDGLTPDEVVQQRGLADVRAAHDRDLDPPVVGEVLPGRG
jgi:hypothetical protein